jgi:hypothetical protein
VKAVNVHERCIYRGYTIRWSLFTLEKPDSRFWVEKDGFHICWANTVDEAKQKIDEVTSDAGGAS